MADERSERPAGKRLFLGVRVSVQTANALAQAAETLARRARDARLDIKWVAPTNYHVTLKFLGWTREDAIHAVRDAVEIGVAAYAREHTTIGTGAVAPIKFRTARLGAFPSLDKASVLWAGVEDPRPLVQLFGHVETALVGIGYAAEKRGFHPHVTIGRLKETRPVRDVVLPLSEQMFSETRVDGVTLFESETKSSGSVYRDLHRIDFKTARNGPFDPEKRQTGALELGDETKFDTQSDTDDGWPRGHGH